MCGIFGYWQHRNVKPRHRPTYREIADLARAAQSRGTDATGIAWESSAPGEECVYVWKSPGAAGAVLDADSIQNLLSPSGGSPAVLIGHTRQATHGSAKDNANNHPQWSKATGTALVHNGVIGNHREVSDRLGLPRVAEVDTEVLLRLWDTVSDETGDKPATIEDRCNRIAREARGSWAIAVLSSQHRGRLALARCDSPLALWWDGKRRILWFASNPDILDRAGIVQGGIGPIPWSVEAPRVPNERWIEIAPDGTLTHGTIAVPKWDCDKGGGKSKSKGARSALDRIYSLEDWFLSKDEEDSRAAARASAYREARAEEEAAARAARTEARSSDWLREAARTCLGGVGHGPGCKCVPCKQRHNGRI